MRSLCAVHAPCMMLSRAADVQKILFVQTTNIYIRHKPENKRGEGEKVKRPGRIEPVSLCASRLLPGAGGGSPAPVLPFCGNAKFVS